MRSLYCILILSGFVCFNSCHSLRSTNFNKQKYTDLKSKTDSSNKKASIIEPNTNFNNPLKNKVDLRENSIFPLLDVDDSLIVDTVLADSRIKSKQYLNVIEAAVVSGFEIIVYHGWNYHLLKDPAYDSLTFSLTGVLSDEVSEPKDVDSVAIIKLKTYEKIDSSRDVITLGYIKKIELGSDLIVVSKKRNDAYDPGIDEKYPNLDLSPIFLLIGVLAIASGPLLVLYTGMFGVLVLILGIVGFALFFKIRSNRKKPKELRGISKKFWLSVFLIPMLLAVAVLVGLSFII